MSGGRKVVEQSVVEGDREVRIRVDAEPGEVRLVVSAVDRPELEYEARVRTLGDPDCTASAPPVRWALWRGLPMVYCSRDPFWLATCWAHDWLFPSTAVRKPDPNYRSSCMRKVYELCRTAAVLAADRCDPAARSIAMKFLPHVRWYVYRHVVRDRSGRLAQLASCCPGALMFAYALDENGVEGEDGPAADALLSGAVAGRPLRSLLGSAVEAWIGAAFTRCPIRRQFDLVWEPIRSRQRDVRALARLQRLLIQRASPRVPTTLLWLPPPEGVVADDMPAKTRARARWYRTIKAAAVIGLHRLDAEDRRRFSGFASAHGDGLYRLARERGFSVTGMLGEIADYVRATGRVPCRRSSLARVAKDAAAWHLEVRAIHLLEGLGIDPGARFPDPPILEWEDAQLSVRAIRTALELLEEGNTMRHCVASYAEEAMKGEAVYYRVLFGRRRGTLEITRTEYGWTITAAKGVANSDLPTEALVAIGRFVSGLNRKVRGAPPAQLGLDLGDTPQPAERSRAA